MQQQQQPWPPSLTNWARPLPYQRPPEPAASERQPSSLRVCDNCIRKKVKCNLGRPTCSRCFERGYTCIYSSTRRKPGPSRGSHRAGASLSSSRSQPPPSPLTPASQCSAGTAVSHEQSAVASFDPPQEARNRNEYWGQLDILLEEEDYLLEKYLDVIHDAFPIFSRARFSLDLKASLYSRDLVVTLLIITAKLIGFTFSSSGFDLDAHIDLMLSSASLQEDLCGDSPSLDQFRKACLLSFYEFHQFPGQQAWMRIGKITRMAYWIHLDRLENSQARCPDWGAIGQDELEDWRYVWWCVYRLDSYATLSAGTPYLVDEELVYTALVRDQQWGPLPDGQQNPQEQKLYLPSQSEALWALLPAITSDSQRTSLFNLHIVTTTAMRQVGRAVRLHQLKPSVDTRLRLATLERHLSELRLALPTNYLNSKRNAFLNETSSDHHARLVTVLHLSMSQLLIALVSCSCWEDEDEWLLSWQQISEICQDITSVCRQWNSTFTLSVDPAVAIIIFIALIFLDLLRKSTAVTAGDLHRNFEHCETVLLLQLEQFASFWALPRLLILSFKGFKEALVGPLSSRHIQSILSRFEAPLHPRWLQFLASAQADLRVS